MPELTVTSPEKISISTGGTMKATVVLLNPGATTASVSFRVAAEHGVTVAPAKWSVRAGRVSPVALTFTPSGNTTKASGQLIVSSKGWQAAVPFELVRKATAPDWALLVIVLPIAVAALLMLGLWGLLPLEHKNGRWEWIWAHRVAASERIGPVDWDFSKSFASNLTVFSAVLGTILSAGVLPKDLSSDRTTTYAALNLLFGIGVIAGPFLYTACQRQVLVNRRGSAKEPQYQGYVWSFLIASGVTVWATAGEFATMGILFGDIRSGGSLPGIGVGAFEAIIVIAAIALFVLVGSRSRAILSAQAQTEKKTVNKSATLSLLRSQGATVSSAEFEPELSAWHAF